MHVKVLYLARLRESLGRASEHLDLPPDGTVAIALALLRERGGAWASELAAGRAVRVAVNKDMAPTTTRLHEGDEVAFFPPVTGG